MQKVKVKGPPNYTPQKDIPKSTKWKKLGERVTGLAAEVRTSHLPSTNGAPTFLMHVHWPQACVVYLGRLPAWYVLSLLVSCPHAFVAQPYNNNNDNDHDKIVDKKGIFWGRRRAWSMYNILRSCIILFFVKTMEWTKLCSPYNTLFHSSL